MASAMASAYAVMGSSAGNRMSGNWIKRVSLYGRVFGNMLRTIRNTPEHDLAPESALHDFLA